MPHQPDRKAYDPGAGCSNQLNGFNFYSLFAADYQSAQQFWNTRYTTNSETFPKFSLWFAVYFGAKPLGIKTIENTKRKYYLIQTSLKQEGPEVNFKPFRAH